MIVGVIVACEIAFWVFVAAGLGARYVLRRERLGMGLLIAAPAADLVLLSVTAFDLGRGGHATFAHGLAAAYLGFSVAYGHRLIAWADRRAAHLRDGTPLPARPFGREYTRQCWADVPRTLLALAVTAGIVWDDLHYTGIGANLGFVVPILLSAPASFPMMSVSTWANDTILATWGVSVVVFPTVGPCWAARPAG